MGNAEYQREYRKTHKENPELKRARQKRYIESHKAKYQSLEYKQKQSNKAKEYRKEHPVNKESHRIRSNRYYYRQKALKNSSTFSEHIEPLTIEQKKKVAAEKAKVYRSTHIEDKEKKKARQSRYQEKNHNIKRGVLTHYGNGKCACVKCGQMDIDCLNLDHINNDAHHRQNNGRVGGEALYKKLMNQNYPIGYQTLCHNCNQKKALEFCRKNGGHKKGKPMETTLPLLEIIQEDAETCHFDIMGA